MPNSFSYSQWTLTAKFLAGIFLASVVVIPVATVIATRAASELVTESYIEKSKIVAQLLDVQFYDPRSLLNEDRLWNILQKTLWLYPDVLEIDVNLDIGSGMITRVSTRADRIGEEPGLHNKQALETDRIVTELVRVEGEKRIRVTAPIHIGRDVPGTIELWTTLEQAEQEAFYLALQIVSVFVALFAVFAAITLVLLKKSVLSPVENLVGYVKASKVKTSDDALQQFDRDEIGVLATALSTMVEELKDRDRSLTDKKQELESALGVAKEADEAKSRMLATASHELRTPLNAIIGFSEVINNEKLMPLSDEKRREYADIINSSGKRMLTLVNELLQISSGREGGRTFYFRDADCADLVRACLSEVRFQAGRKSIEIKTENYLTTAEMQVDEDSARQVITNVLSNAVKYTDENGTVTVSMTSDDEYLWVKVADNGIGISAKELHRVTEPFYRAHNQSDVARQGTGLGLAIVKANIEVNKGILDIESTRGVGTTVTMGFPAAR